MAKKQKPVEFETELVRSTTGSGWHFLIFEKELAEPLGFEDKFRRVVCTMNGDADDAFQCALLPWGELFYIIVNKKRRERLGLEAGDKVRVSLVRDESKYGLPMPEEFEEVLKQDPKGDRLFHALGKGKQRSILYLLSRPKDVDARIQHSLIIVQHLKDNDGKIIDKQLYEELKRPVL